MIVAFTFPGQGSQTVAGGTPWVGSPSWEVVGRASELSGVDVEHLLLKADGEELRDTLNAQLSTFVLSLVMCDAVRRAGVEAEHYAGHSLGEYTALTAAGGLGFADGVCLVTVRGEAMRAASAARAGVMVAVIGLDEEAISDACAAAGTEVWVANDNAPGQIVIAGAAEAVADAAAAAREAGARKAMALPVAGAFHTPYMEPARPALESALTVARFRDPTGAVWANVDASPHARAGDWPAVLSAQLTAPVRWRETIENMAGQGVELLVELGPGSVLTGLAKRTVAEAGRISVGEPEDVPRLVELVAGA
ncbi:MAG: Malonyl CoA-acyl carrier protein transacylase [Acidimicrobiales bacterium]|nr:Malonyl CoA-acyl carrier protein transacylase [Acidimicrobiales bacterium]